MPDPDPTPSTDVPRPAAPMPWKDRIDLLTQSPSLSPIRIAGGVAVALALVVAAWLLLRTPPGPPVDELLPRAGSSEETAAAPSTTSTTVASVVVAHAAGAVAHPGVYELDAGARVTDLIDAAGGALPDADVDRLNLAAPVTDGERVYVPRVGEVVVAAPDVSGEADAPTGPLDLNTATLEQLEALPGIGPATAQAIVDERDRRGGFTSVDQLLDVRGIGPAKLDAIRDLVTV